MTRRITFSRDSVVKLNGKPTRWRVTRAAPGEGWLAYQPEWPPERDCTARTMTGLRACLATLTDAELLG
jgi:hypothetical protein